MSARASTLSRASVVRQAGPFSAQPLDTQLSQSALTALENLKKSEAASTNGSLQKTLARAAELIQNIATTVNDRAAEERTRRHTRLARLKRDGEEESGEAKEQHENFQKQVEDLTKKMDEGIRRIADNQHWVKELPNSIKHVIDQSKDHQSRSQRRQRDEDRGENEDDEDSPQPPGQPDANEAPSVLLHAAQTTAEAEWSGKSLTDRYFQNETYKTYYELIWHAKNPGEHPPPMPHHSLWFAAQEGRNPSSSQHPRSMQRGTQRSTQSQDGSGLEGNEDRSMLGAADDEEEELQISSHVRSTKCPLTLRYFVNPVTSTKCPHSFEKDAVLGFIRQSSERLPLTTDQIVDLDHRHPQGSRGRPQAEASMRGRNPKHARCPEGGCTTWLTENDLRPDPVLARMVKRAKEAERREQEEERSDDEFTGEDSDNDGLAPGTQRRRKKAVPIDSSPTGASTAGGRRRTLIKGEREVSVVPNSQVPGGTSNQRQDGRGRGMRRVMDLDDEDDEDE